LKIREALKKCTDDLSSHSDELRKIDSKLDNPSCFQSYLFLRSKFYKTIHECERINDDLTKGIEKYKGNHVDVKNIEQNNTEISNRLNTEINTIDDKFKNKKQRIDNEMVVGGIISIPIIASILRTWLLVMLLGPTQYEMCMR